MEQSSFPLLLRDADIAHFRFSRVPEDSVRDNMYRFAKAAVNISSKYSCFYRLLALSFDFHSTRENYVLKFNRPCRGSVTESVR